ncbi:MAG: heat shock protein HspQ [Rhodospirillales bacterium]|nr:heat shock protein HspQ [Rhodospirillales bacterium]
MAERVARFDGGFCCAARRRATTIGRTGVEICGQFEPPVYARRAATVTDVRHARFQIGQVVRHRIYPFRGVIFDVDPQFANTEEWWLSIPENVRPHKDQPFYHLLAENAETTYIAYVSEQNLIPDDSGDPVSHPQIEEIFAGVKDGRYVSRRVASH